MPSEKFLKFMEDFFGDPTPTVRDGLNLQSLRDLEPADKAQAEELFLQALEASGLVDFRVVMGVSELRMRRAVAPLKKLLAQLRTAGKAGSSESVRYATGVALALWRIEPFPEAPAYVIDALKNSPDQFVRIDAAIALRQFRCQESLEALKAALTDEAYLVRNHVTKSLLALGGQLKSEIDTPPLAVQMMSDDLGERQKAMAELNSLTSQLSLPRCL